MLSLSRSRLCSSLSISRLSMECRAFCSSSYLLMVWSCSSISMLMDVMWPYVSLNFSLIAVSLFLVWDTSLLKLLTSLTFGRIFSKSLSFLNISSSWSFLSDFVSKYSFQPSIRKSNSSSSCGTFLAYLFRLPEPSTPCINFMASFFSLFKLSTSIYSFFLLSISFILRCSAWYISSGFLFFLIFLLKSFICAIIPDFWFSSFLISSSRIPCFFSLSSGVDNLGCSGIFGMTKLTSISSLLMYLIFTYGFSTITSLFSALSGLSYPLLLFYEYSLSWSYWVRAGLSYRLPRTERIFWGRVSLESLGFVYERSCLWGWFLRSFMLPN